MSGPLRAPAVLPCGVQSLFLSAGQVVYGRQLVDLTGETFTNISLFEDHLNYLLCDLTSFSMDTYSKVGAVWCQGHSVQLCVCACVRALRWE